VAINFIGGGNRSTRSKPLRFVASHWQSYSHIVAWSTPYTHWSHR